MSVTEITLPPAASRYGIREADNQRMFETLYQQTRKRAYNLAYRMAGNASAAEDITQEAYLRAWRHFDRFDQTSSFAAWFFRILTNVAIGWSRARKRHPVASLDAPMGCSADGEPYYHEVADTTSDPAKAVLSAETESRLRTALATLPEEYRLAVLLADVEERSYQEIAEMLCWPLGTVRSRIHRARQRLRRVLRVEMASQTITH